MLNDKLYVMGSDNRCEVYDAATDRWTSCPPLSAQHWSRSMLGASDGEAVYFLGGVDGNDDKTLVESLVGDHWVERAPLPAHLERGAVAGGNGLIYYSGGLIDFYAQSFLLRYEVAYDYWRGLPGMPRALVGHQMVLYNNDLYVFPPGSTEVWVFNTDREVWRVIQPAHPAPVAWGYLALTHGNRILRIGGTDFYPNEILTDVWSFDPATEDFSVVAPLQTSRSSLVGGVLAGRPYAGLGYGGDTVGLLHSLEALLPCPPGCGVSQVYLPAITK